MKQSANELIDEIRDVIVDVERAESERASNENYRKQAESVRVNNEQARKNSDLTRENQETKRQQAESERENNEKQRRIDEFERVENENTRQSAESQRQSMFETNESERQNTFETAESERVSNELIRIENENQRNLTSVDEFIKLQDAIGGRNYLLNSGEPNSLRFISNNSSILPLIRGVDDGVEWVYQNNLNTNEFTLSTFVGAMEYSTDWSGYIGDITMSVDVMSTHPVTLRLGFSNKAKDTLTPNEWRRITFTSKATSGLYAETSDNKSVPHKTKVYWKNFKIEKGTQVTPYIKAPEDYEVVSKEDFYNHIKLINDVKNNQFNQLKQAVIALGGTI